MKDRGITVNIHVRRSDQLTDAHGGKDPGVNYFETVLGILGDAAGAAITAVVCTDDAAWIRQQAVFDVMHIRDASSVSAAHEHLSILASCQHLIISIGTFGWWAAYMHMELAGRTFYYATPFKRELDYKEHFLPLWATI